MFGMVSRILDICHAIFSGYVDINFEDIFAMSRYDIVPCAMRYVRMMSMGWKEVSSTRITDTTLFFLIAKLIRVAANRGLQQLDVVVPKSSKCTFFFFVTVLVRQRFPLKISEAPPHSGSSILIVTHLKPDFSKNQSHPDE